MPRSVSVQREGYQSAPRCRLSVSSTLWQQLLKYANIPVSGEYWAMGVLVCSLCTVAWRDSQLRTVSLFAPLLLKKSWTQAPLATKPGVQESCPGLHPEDLGCQRYTQTLSGKYQWPGARQRESVKIVPADDLPDLWRVLASAPWCVLS